MFGHGDGDTIEGEGTESFPWCGMNSAVAALLIAKPGRAILRLKPGERLVISHKEPFTPSRLGAAEKNQGNHRRIRVFGHDRLAGLARGSYSWIFSGESMAGVDVFFSFRESDRLHESRRHLGAFDRHFLSGAVVACLLPRPSACWLEFI